MKKTYLMLILILIVLSIGVLVVVMGKTPVTKPSDITNFDECVSAGNPVMESYPRRCAASGKTFVEDIGNELEKIELIQVENPRPNVVVKSPLEVKGQARGTWYFEAEFPVKLFDSDDNLISEGTASADGDWMTEDFVPFTVNLSFTSPKPGTGELKLIKANPSDLPENTDELIIPVVFE